MSSERKKADFFLENPYDLETVFESLGIAGEHGKELLYMDRLIASIRKDPNTDLTDLNYRILESLKVLKVAKNYKMKE